MNSLRANINPEEGTIFLKLKIGVLSRSHEEEITLWQHVHKNSIFQLVLRPDYLVRFYRSNMGMPTRMAEVDVTSIIESEQPAITVTWSPSNDCLYAGKIGSSSLLISEARDYPDIKLGIDRNNQIYRVGDVGVVVGFFSIREGGKTVACSTPKEVFDFQLTKIEILLKLCPGPDYLTESVLVQQSIVMMTTAFEVYVRDRFVEISMKNESLINLDAMYDFVPSKYRVNARKEIEERFGTAGEQVLEFINQKSVLIFRTGNHLRMHIRTHMG